ncbi:MAG: hypothetical protein HZB44_03245 [Actinobacteria bacterium]|nr:hypothetical protein [Actinomycetota bacterium]
MTKTRGSSRAFARRGKSLVYPAILVTFSFLFSVGLFFSGGEENEALAVCGGCTICDYVPVDLSSQTGLPGEKINISGGGPANDLDLSDLTLLWDGTDINANLTKSFDNFSGFFYVPPDAAPGQHFVTISFPDPNNLQTECYVSSFTVANSTQQSVQQQAYSEAPSAPLTALPNTGFFLVLPAVGLALGGLCLVLRRGNRL